MGQDAIWDHFQNEGVSSFEEARPRLEFLARHVKPGERLLNIGVGSGLLEELALRKGADAWSLDPSKRAIERLRERLKLGEHAQVGYSQDIPYGSGQFDVVVMSEVLEHLEPAVFEATLDEVRRVLRPGGRFIGTVPAREQLEQSQVVCPDCGSHFHRWGHQTSFTCESLGDALRSRFPNVSTSELFLVQWDNVNWIRRGAGILKKFLSWRGLGPYGTLRSIFFVASMSR